MTAEKESGTGAFYSLWPKGDPSEPGGIDAYRRDLLTWALDPERLAPTQLTMSSINGLRAGGNLDPQKIVHDLARENFNGYLQPGIPRFALLAFWAAAPCYNANSSRAVGDAEESYELVRELAKAFTWLFELLNRRPRAPWNSNKIAEVVGCLAEGMMLRAVAGSPDAARVDAELFADSVVALMAATTVDVDATDLDSQDFTLWARANLPLVDHNAPPSLPAIGQAANMVYRRCRKRFADVTTATVAEEAGCSAKTVQTLFPPAPAGLAVPIWREQVFLPLRKYAYIGRSNDETPLQRLESCMRELARLTRQDRDLALAFQSVANKQAGQIGNVRAGSSARTLCPIHEILELDLHDAWRKDNFLGSELATHEARSVLAEFLASCVITRVITRPHDTDEATARFVLRALLPSTIGGAATPTVMLTGVDQRRMRPSNRLVTVPRKNFDADLLEKFYETVLVPAMPPYSTLSLADLKNYYLGDATIGPAAITLQGDEPVAGLLTQYFHRSRILLITYLAVREDLRQTGVGTAALEASIPAWQEQLGARAVLAETEDPRCHQATPDTGDPSRRIRLYERLGAAAFPMAYFHPVQSSGQSRGYGYLLIGYGCKRGSLPRTALADFLDDYFGFCEGRSVVSQDPEYLKMREQVSRATGNMSLVPLSRYVDIDRTGFEPAT